MIKPDATTSSANTAATARQRELLLSLSDNPVPINGLRLLTPRLAEMYATKSEKTLTRDVNRLHSLGLVYIDKHTLRAAIDIMAAFIPGVAG